MTNNDKEIVTSLCAALLEILGEDRYSMWFEETTRFELREDELAIFVARPLYMDWIRGALRDDIEEACRRAFGRVPTLSFHTDETLIKKSGRGRKGAKATRKKPATTTASSEPIQLSLFSENAESAPSASCDLQDAASLEADSADTAVSVSVLTEEVQVDSDVDSDVATDAEIDTTVEAAPRRRRRRVDRSTTETDGRRSIPGTHRRFSTFETFVTGYGNRLAVASAQTAAYQPGSLSPLTFAGPTSVGKSHLLEAISVAARRELVGAATAIYMTVEQFMTRYVEAVRERGLPAFRSMFDNVHVLLIDDLRYLAGRRGTQVELVHLIDQFQRFGRQVVFTTDRPPAEMMELTPELVTRLEGGMICRIGSPDQPTRLGIVTGLARRMNMDVPRDVLAYIATRLTSHSRQLAGALCRIRAMSEVLRRPIDLELAQTALVEMVAGGTRSVRLDDIEKAVCQVFDVDGAALRSNRRVKRITYPRMLAMWLARKHTRAALTEISSFFGRQSHTTVLSAQRRVDDWVEQGESFELAGIQCDVDEAIRQVESRLAAK